MNDLAKSLFPMQKRTLPLAFLGVFLFLLLFKTEKASACGFGFLGTCASKIWMKIDASSDSFPVGPCTFGTPLDGLDFGSVWSLRLESLRAATWESCSNQVKTTDFFYRIYEDGQAAGPFLQWSMPLDSIKTEGPYRTRFRTIEPKMELLDGLVGGKSYVLELFLRAQVDTTSDGQPDRDFFLNGGGADFRVRFRKSTAAADPFTVVVTRAVDNVCHGDSAGIASVYAYGLGEPFQYDWENDYHFWAQYELPADDWTISVVNSAGFVKSKTITVGEPPEQIRSFEKSICKGSSFDFEGQIFSQAGHFELKKPAPNGCDSVLRFDLKMLDPAFALADLPDSVLVDCFDSTVEICATAMPNTDFAWASATQNLSADRCVAASGVDGLFVTAYAPAGLDFCSASRFVKVVTDTSRPAFLVQKSPKCDGTALVSTQKDDLTSLAWSSATVGSEPFSFGAGQFSVTATGANGCSATAFFDVFEAIKFDLEAVSATVGQEDGSAILKNLEGGKGPLQLAWSNGSTAFLNTNLSGPAWFAATISDTEGCSKTDSVFVDAVVATADFEDEKWMLAPDPAFDFIEIWSTQLVDYERLSCRVVDPSGRLLKIFEPKKRGEKARLDLCGLPAGLLFLVIETEGKRSVSRFVKS